MVLLISTSPLARLVGQRQVKMDTVCADKMWGNWTPTPLVIYQSNSYYMFGLKAGAIDLSYSRGRGSNLAGRLSHSPVGYGIVTLSATYKIRY